MVEADGGAGTVGDDEAESEWVSEYKSGVSDWVDIKEQKQYQRRRWLGDNKAWRHPGKATDWGITAARGNKERWVPERAAQADVTQEEHRGGDSWGAPEHGWSSR